MADTSALVALIDGDDRHHKPLLALYDADPDQWVLPWAVLPEVDYLLGAHVSVRAQTAFVADLAEGRWPVEWGDERDLARAREIDAGHAKLHLGLVDAVVMAVAERLGADIATLDLRDFGAVTLRGEPRLLPRDA